MTVTVPFGWLPGTIHFNRRERVRHREDAGAVVQALMLSDSCEVFEVRSWS